ncbi:bifunctional hydroxymethylpyrimidine kinase/phosphomethylpyrimidine kinase [Roseibacillus ishigakijimensis]|uniref:hydroxymethylpyrimidine kinase n=1 Tax=Roseibacillus ishigakijimensis TaxID=454146 RepID=A0A934VIU1_9BACT|nr:hydroxymethylpyrimidine/phosphomethylpyrimidine kinase [Roseibacillus ishigakijimensis]MBK1835428.1 hydroxymethylpyrimidine/phosphomethylpyrimidine kinase [Roseibacillus ishigakijimensis]
MTPSPPVALTIAGFDTSSGAGLQADLLTFHQLGLHALTAATSLVVETPREVRSQHPVPPSVLLAQVELLLSQYPVAVIKIGLLARCEQVRAIAPLLAAARLPLVIDPVGISSTGSAMQEAGTDRALRHELAPLARLLTPNFPEACRLTGSLPSDEPHEVARRLARETGAAVLLTGGHHGSPEEVHDFLVSPEGERSFTSSRLAGATSLHGTGCVLSSAIAAGLGKGQQLADAVASGRAYLRQTLLHPLSWGEEDPMRALNHQAHRASHEE